MTLLGKVFTGLILVMSVMFMAFSIVVYATHVNWKAKAKAKDASLQSLQSNIDTLDAEMTRYKNALARERAARKVVVASLQTKYDQKTAELVEKEREYEKLLADNLKMSNTVETQAVSVQNLQKEVGIVRNSLMEAIDVRTTLFDAMVALTDQKNALDGARGVLKERYDTLLADVNKAVAHLAVLGVKLGDDLPTGAPDVDGFVTNVNNQNLIEISLGDDDGLREGHELYVYRGATFLGRAVIRRTSADFAVAEIVEEVNRTVLIRKGDRVSTKLG